MLEGHSVRIHARLAAQIAIRPAANEIVDTEVVEPRLRPKAEVAVHQSKTAFAGHETADNGPGHRRGLGKNFRKVVAAPHRALRIGAGRQSRDLLAPDLLALGGACRGD